jgi:hypothetical protein
MWGFFTDEWCLVRAAADVLYEILTMMVKKGPLTVSESGSGEL